MRTLAICTLCRRHQLDDNGACVHCDRRCTKRGCTECHEINEAQRKQHPARWPQPPEPPAAA